MKRTSIETVAFLNNINLFEVYLFPLHLINFTDSKAMKTIRISLFILAVSLSATSCKKSVTPEPLADITTVKSESADKAVSADTVSAEEMVHSSAAVEGKSDSAHRFIRTAELKFKTQNVVKTTNAIEDLTNRMGGYVAYTNLTSSINYSETKNINPDSSVVITRYIVSNEMTLRVPNTKLDSTLKLIARHILYLDYRIVKADNVALQIHANNLAVERTGKYQKRLTDAIDKKGAKLNETVNAEESLLDKRQDADDARISNLSLEDQINYSTITLSIYQNQGVMHELIANEENVKEYEPHIGLKILYALKNGWDLLQSILIFVFEIWGLILLAILGYVGYRQYRKYLKKKAPKSDNN